MSGVISWGKVTSAGILGPQMATLADPLPVALSGTGALASRVQGNGASGVADVGDPVKVGGVYNAVLPAGATGQRGDIQLDSAFNVRARALLVNTNSTDGLASNALGTFGNVANQSGGNYAGIFNYSFGNTVWDRERTIQGVINNGIGVKAVATAAHNQPGGAIAPVATVALASSLGIAGAQNLYRLNAAATTVAGWFLIFDSVALPADGAVTPVKFIPVAASAGIDWDFSGMPERFNLGCWVAFSTAATPYTKTSSATAAISITRQL